MAIPIVLTEAEINQLAKLMDSAVRAEGLPAAVAAVPIFKKLKAAVEATKDESDHVPHSDGL